jgi:large subunit ribosomal protein L24
MTIKGAQLAGLDPKAFDVAIRAADQGLTIDAPRIGALVSTALDSGRLAVPQLDGAITIQAGQARLAQTIARVDGAELALAGQFDLSENIFEARLTLSSTRIAPITGSGRPELSIALKGPIAAAKRVLDVSALVDWLTLRAVDQQVSRLEAIESDRKSSLESAVPATLPENMLPRPAAPD